jgi:hypothetical protein
VKIPSDKNGHTAVVVAVGGVPELAPVPDPREPPAPIVVEDAINSDLGDAIDPLGAVDT